VEQSGLILLAIGLLFSLLILRRHLRKVKRRNRSDETQMLHPSQTATDEKPDQESYLHLLSSEGQRQVREDQERDHQKVKQRSNLKGF